MASHRHSCLRVPKVGQTVHDSPAVSAWGNSVPLSPQMRLLAAAMPGGKGEKKEAEVCPRGSSSHLIPKGGQVFQWVEGLRKLLHWVTAGAAGAWGRCCSESPAYWAGMGKAQGQDGERGKVLMTSVALGVPRSHSRPCTLHAGPEGTHLW